MQFPQTPVIARSKATWQSTPTPLVIARSKATWQSIFQVVQDSRWIASPPARNDRGGWLAMTEGVGSRLPFRYWRLLFL